MPVQTRLPYTLPNPGPFLATVTNNLDVSYMGSLEVSIIKGYVNDPDIQSQTYIVNYLSPFYGVTDIRHEGNNPGLSSDVQTSYGMWMIPPDIGATVMVIFLDGDPNQGYWMGCVLNDRYQNHMVPGIAASTNVILTPEQKTKYDVNYLPVSEFHKRSAKNTSNPNSIPKPVNPFADVLLKQGLLADKIRGVTSSSARREIPSSVFGISTPGRLNPKGKRGLIGYESKVNVPVSRTGGHTFVMDDGDALGDNQLVRIRSSSGHQILLNDTSNLIYIGNALGTAWIEMTADGKLDIFCEDSVSIHTKADFNFRADRDINLEAGRNININALGSADVNIGDHYFVSVNGQGKLSFAKTLDTAIGGISKTMVGETMHVNVGDSAYYTSNSEFNISSESSFKLSSGADINIGSSGEIKASGSDIHLNGPAASAAQPAANAEIPSLLPTYMVPATNGTATWSGNRYKARSLTTILQRVPMHEPWTQHEDNDRTASSSASTDITATSRPDVISPVVPVIPANPSADLPGVCSLAAIKAISSPSAQSGITALKLACAEMGITNAYAVAAILGITGGESEWIAQSEGYYYSPTALPVIFSKTFRGKPDLIEQYALWKGTREDFFTFVYAPENNGSQLGNTQEGDGGRFFGRGFIQLTGRSNYKRYATLSGVDILSTPELLVTDVSVSAKVAVSYFKDRVKLSQTDPLYFENALSAVGGARSGWDKKREYYQCFLANLQGTTALPV